MTRLLLLSATLVLTVIVHRDALCFSYTQLFYVRPPGSVYGKSDGSSWDNAYSNLPVQLVRGAKYYLASGDYDTGPAMQYYYWHRFDDDEIGAQYIGIYKATAADHGTDSGWHSDMGSGAANLGPLEFVTGYYVLDGQTGSGVSGHGIKISTRDCSNPEAKNIRFTWNSISKYIELHHLDIGHCGSTGYTLSQDNIYGNVVGQHILHDIVINSCYIHDANRAHMVILDAADILIENSYFARSGKHQESTSLAPRNVDNFVVRNSVFKDTKNNFIDFRTADNVHIYSNIFLGARKGWEIYSAIESFSPSSNVFIYNNTFYNLKGLNVGIRLGSGPHVNAQVFNNLWAGNRANQIMLTGNHDYNAFFDNWRVDSSGNKIHNLDERIVEAHAEVLELPPFTSELSGDFHLMRPTAPGRQLTAPFDRDPDHRRRGGDGIWDRGAFEYLANTISGPNILLLKQWD